MSRLYSRYKSRYFIGIFLIKTLAAAGIKNGDMIMAVHADMLQFNSSGQSNSSSRSRTSSTTGQPDFDASARQLIQSCRNDRQKRNQVWVLDFSVYKTQTVTVMLVTSWSPISVTNIDVTDSINENQVKVFEYLERNG